MRKEDTAYRHSSVKVAKKRLEKEKIFDLGRK